MYIQYSKAFNDYNLNDFFIISLLNIPKKNKIKNDFAYFNSNINKCNNDCKIYRESRKLK